MKISQCLAISSIGSLSFIYSVTVSLLGHSTTRSQPSSQSTVSGSHERNAEGPDRSEPWKRFASRPLISYVLLRRRESSCFYFGISSVPWEVYQDTRANLQLKGMGFALFLFAVGQYFVEDCDQEVVVGQTGTASYMACGCWNELPCRQLINAPTLTSIRITSPSLKLSRFN